MSNLELIQTDDGSNSIYNPELDETYHSRYGAITESTHVFINAGFSHSSERGLSRIRVLEVGLGTGLNVLLTCHYAEVMGQAVDYLGLEPYPLAVVMAKKLNFRKNLSFDPRNWLEQIHEGPWNEQIKLTDKFILKKLLLGIGDYRDGSERFDLVYFDAFGPSKQPSVWTFQVIENVVDLLSKGGSLVTYSAQGQFRRNLEVCGCSVEILPGPPGKAQMTRATKN